jgi:lipopolysaccharide transport system permease protein
MTRVVGELIEHREVLITLIIRDILSRYKQTIVGVAWAILQPLFMMVIFSIIFSRFTTLPSEGAPYPLFCIVALIPWAFFSNAVNIAIPSLVDNESLITKIYFPREILPIAAVCAVLIDSVIATAIFIAVSAVFHISLAFHALLIILFIIQLLFTLGIVFFACAINVFYRDVKLMVPFLIQLAMFATPIVYSADMITTKHKFFYMLNPMAVAIDGYRKVILKGALPETRYLLTGLAVSLMVFIFGYLFFKLVEKHFADSI